MKDMGMKKMFLVVLAFGGAVLLSGCTTPEKRNPLLMKNDELSFNAEKEADKKRAEDRAAAEQEKAKAKEVTQKIMYQTPPAMQVSADKKYTETLHTSEGDIVISLNVKEVPQTVNNFVFLGREKFYDGTIFHRTIPGFMIQGGDPTGTGMGGPGYKFPDEKFAGTYTRGTVAMANSGPNTNGSQFFIMHQDTALPPNYTIFGSVVSGMEVVDKIAGAPTKPGGEGSSPVNPVGIISVEVTEE